MPTLIGEAATHVNTRARRRALVAAMYLSAAAIGVLERLEGAGGGWTETARPVATLAFIVAIVLLGHLTYHSKTNPDTLLDERGRSVRDRAYRQAHHAVSVLATAGLLYLVLAVRLGWAWVPGTTGEWLGVAFAATFLTASLPIAIIAWTEPDFPAEDPEDAEMERRALRGVPVSRVRVRTVAALAVAGVALTALQYAGAGPLPARHNSLLAGLTTGLLFGLALIAEVRRRARR